MPFAIRYWATKDDFDDNKDDGIPVWGNAYEKTFKTADKMDRFIKRLRETSQYAYQLGEWDGDECGANIDWSWEIVYIDRPTRYIPGSPDHKIICKYLLQNEDTIIAMASCQVFSEYIVFKHLGIPYLQLTLDIQHNGVNYIKFHVGIATPLDEATQNFRIHESEEENYQNMYLTTFKMRQLHKTHLRLTPEIVDEIAKAIEESISV